MNFTMLQLSAGAFSLTRRSLFRKTLFPVLLLLAACSGKDSRDPKEDAEVHVILERGSQKIDSGHAREALRYIDSIFAAREPLSVREQFAYYSFYCSYYYKNQVDYDRSLAYADSMLRLIEKQKDIENYSTELAGANYSIGDVLFAQRKYSEAYKYLYVAKRLVEETSDPCSLGQYSYRIGMILYKQGRFAAAASYFEQSLKESATCPDNFFTFYRKQELMSNTALSFAKLSRPDSALAYYDKALDLVKKNEGRFAGKESYYEVARGVIYGNQAQAYAMKGDFTRAEKLYLRSIAINVKDFHDNTDALYNRLHLAELYLRERRLSDALPELDIVRQSLAETYNPDLKLTYSRLMWLYYQQKGDDRNALARLIAYNAVKDSIENASREFIAANASDQLSNLEKEHEIVFLRKNKEINDLYFKILIVVAALSLAVVLLIFQNWRRSKSNVRGLRRLNDQVTEQKVKLEQTLGELEQKSREKDRILRAVAHDLRNPIGGIASVSGLLLEDQHGAEEQEMLGLIQSTCQDALLLINEILEISSVITSADMPVEPVDVNMLAFNTIELLRFKAVEKGQQLVLETSPQPAVAMANREKLARVLSNLVSNAIKFSRADGKTVVKVWRTTDHIRVSVADNGIGIPESIRSKVFDIFTEAKRSGTAGEKPFGLGLSISRQIMDALAGTIWFENNPGGGTVFIIELPACDQQDSEAVTRLGEHRI